MGDRALFLRSPNTLASPTLRSRDGKRSSLSVGARVGVRLGPSPSRSRPLTTQTQTHIDRGSDVDGEGEHAALLELAHKERVVGELRELLRVAEMDLEKCRAGLRRRGRRRGAVMDIVGGGGGGGGGLGAGSTIELASEGIKALRKDPLVKLATESLHAMSAIYNDIRSATVGHDAAK
ncbi:hypothetical protein PYCC9005_004485 [Savitreella phatthalungensis]